MQTATIEALMEEPVTSRVMSPRFFSKTSGGQIMAALRKDRAPESCSLSARCAVSSGWLLRIVIRTRCDVGLSERSPLHRRSRHAIDGTQREQTSGLSADAAHSNDQRAARWPRRRKCATSPSRATPRSPGRAPAGSWPAARSAIVAITNFSSRFHGSHIVTWPRRRTGCSLRW
jgi:hypothetical protein